MREYYVYFLSSFNNKVLYTGITNNLERRVYEHQTGQIKGFASKYNLKKLVYFETCAASQTAIEREKQLKNWSRKKKNRLVETMNKDWQDLAEGWFKDPSTSLGMTGESE